MAAVDKSHISKVKDLFKYRKPILPFISSTFTDFQIERDMLVKNVFPALNALCHSRGTYCAPIDLRWGINEKQANQSQVIRLCFDYIEKCTPFFIGLLGERYGTHRSPDQESGVDVDDDWFEKNVEMAASSGYEWIKETEYRYCSVTELEIIHATFRADSRYARFYFRRPEHLHSGTARGQQRGGADAKPMTSFGAENEFAEKRVISLKSQVAKRGLSIKYFNTPEELCTLVLSDWTAIINELFPPLENMVLDAYSERVVEWLAHETFAETRRKTFIKTPSLQNIFQSLTDFLYEDTGDSKDGTLMLLSGPRGCGKTSVIANWLGELSVLQENNVEVATRVSVVSHHVGASSLSFDAIGLMRRLTIALKDECGDPPVTSDTLTPSSNAMLRAENGLKDDYVELSDETPIGGRPEYKDWRDQITGVRESFNAALAFRPCLVVIDGVDELTATYGISQQKVKQFQWIPSPLPRNSKIILTASDADTAYKTISKRPGVRKLTVPLLTEGKYKEQIINKHLSAHCKTLTNEQLKRIVDCKQSNKPIFLSILSNELRIFGAYSQLDDYLDSYLETTSIRQLWSRVICRWINDYSDCKTVSLRETNATPKSYTGWVADALRLIAVSRHGLCSGEATALLRCRLGYTRLTNFQWGLFKSATVDSLFSRPGGLLKFFHKHFKDAVEFTLLGRSVETCPPKAMKRQHSANDFDVVYHRHLAAFFSAQPHSFRRTEELPWHLVRCSDWKQLIEVLTDSRIFLYMFGSMETGCCFDTKKRDLMMYWRELEQNGYDIATSHIEMIERAKLQAESGEDMSLPTTTEMVMSNYPREKTDNDNLNIKGCPLMMQAHKEAIQMKKKSSFFNRQDSIKNSEIDFSKDSVVSMAILMESVGGFLILMECYEAASKVLNLAHESLKNISDVLDKKTLSITSQLEETISLQYYIHTDYESSYHWLNKSLESIQNIIEICILDGQDDVPYKVKKSHILDMLGYNESELGYLESSRIHFHEADLLMKEYGCPVGVATVQYHRANLKKKQGNYMEAERDYRQSMEVLDKQLGRPHFSVGDVMFQYAELISQADLPCYNPDKAESLYRQALLINNQLFGAANCFQAIKMYKLGVLLTRKTGKLAQKEASNLLRTAYDIRLLRLGKEHKLTKIAKATLNRNENCHRLYDVTIRGNYVDHLTTGKGASPVNKDTGPVKNAALCDDFYLQQAGVSCTVSDTVHGPNSSFNVTPAPTTVESKATSHQSAWYHVPGRYPTKDKPYAPARSQKRVNTLRLNYDCGGGGNDDVSKNSGFIEVRVQDA